MKKFVILILMASISIINANAQGIIDESYLELIEKNATPLWADATGKFTGINTPEKFKNESAIILGFKRDLSIDKQSKSGFLTRGERSLVFLENVRFKIKLNDRNAVSSFTSIYFRYSDKIDGFSAKIYKKEGSVINVNLNDAVSVESISDVPEFFKSFFDQEVGAEKLYYKVAIPDLEIGDILEYVSITKNKLNVRGSGLIEFSPQYELCNKVYPILFNQIAIEVDEKSFFKALSKNGAPNFVKEESANKDFFRFVFTDKDRATEKDVNFISSYKQSPFTKFQVIYSNKADAKGTLLGNIGEIKSEFTKEELAKKAWEDYAATSDYYLSGQKVEQYIDAFYKDLKRRGARNMDDDEFIKSAYYRIRNFVGFRDRYLSDKYAAYIFGSLLYQKKIESEVVICVSNKIGDLKDILFDDEIRYALKVKDKFYFNFTDFSNPGDLVENLLGSNAYIIKEPNKKTGEQEIISIVLPNATLEQNSSLLEIEASLSDNYANVDIVRKNTYKGISKNNEISDALKYTTYMLEDYTNYGGEDPTEKLRGKDREKYDKNLYNYEEENKKQKKEYSKKLLQREFSTKVDFKSIKINSDGRSQSFKDLIFTETFSIPNNVLKAGKNLLVNIPGLVGGQLHLKKEERVRNNDIDMNYARSINWIIKFKVPDGFTAEGVSELNKTINNEIGTFNCTASNENGFVTLNIKKVYKQSNFPKAKWNELMAFVDAAYNNSFKNILLRAK